jgi:hypothetical protein
MLHIEGSHSVLVFIQSYANGERTGQTGPLSYCAYTQHYCRLPSSIRLLLGIVSDNQSRVVDGRHYSVASIAHSVTRASAIKAAAASGGNFSHGQASGQTPTYLPTTAWRWFRLLSELTPIHHTHLHTAPRALNIFEEDPGFDMMLKRESDYVQMKTKRGVHRGELGVVIGPLPYQQTARGRSHHNMQNASIKTGECRISARI